MVTQIVSDVARRKKKSFLRLLLAKHLVTLTTTYLCKEPPLDAMLLYIDMRWRNMASAHTLDKANFISFRGSRKTGAAPSGRM